MLHLTPKDKLVGGPPKRKEIKQEPRETEKPKMFYFSTWAMVLNTAILEMTTKPSRKVTFYRELHLSSHIARRLLRSRDKLNVLSPLAEELGIPH